MGKKSTPAPPDYTGAAQAQGQANQEALTSQTWANRPTINTPWGTQSWTPSSTIDPATGQRVTSWESNINLSPQQQAALDSQMQIQQGLSASALQALPGVQSTLGTPVDFSGLPQGGSAIDTSGWSSGRPLAFSFGDAGPLQRSVASGPVQTSIGAGNEDWRQRGQDAALSFLKPQQDERRSAAEARLANMGISRGSEAWQQEMRSLMDQDTRDSLSAFGAGRDEAAFQFGVARDQGTFANTAQNQAFQQALAQAGLFNTTQQTQFDQGRTLAEFGNTAAMQELMQQGMFGQQQAQAGEYNQSLRQQSMAEMLRQRQTPLNELNALLTGQQVDMPQMPGFNPSGRAEAPDLVGAANSMYGAEADQYNARQSRNASYANSAATAYLAYLAFSDRRLKKDITHVFTLANGIKIYKYRFIGSDRFELGVIAQEVKEVMPEAVAEDSQGFLKVNYNMVLA